MNATARRPARPERGRPRGRGASALSVLLDRDEEARALRGVAEALSHELRTPLTAIYTGSKILSRPGLPLSDSTIREVSAAIEAEAERLKRVVEDLVVAALPAGGAVGGEPILLGHLLPAIVAHERDRAPDVRFVLSIPERLPAVRGDEAYMEQVVRNLLANATRFGPPDGPVTIRATERPGAVEVQIADEGPGIEAADTERVFDLFYRSSAAGKAGLGLGLYVCRRLVAAMGGRIWARRRPRGGAEFGFELPAFPADEG